MLISLTSSINRKDAQIHEWTYLYISDSNCATLFLCNGCRKVYCSDCKCWKRISNNSIIFCDVKYVLCNTHMLWNCLSNQSIFTVTVNRDLFLAFKINVCFSDINYINHWSNYIKMFCGSIYLLLRFSVFSFRIISH